MDYINAAELVPGDVISFTGGTGRADEQMVYTAVVNGEPYTRTGEVCYVPVHIPAINHNVIVAHTNIIGLAIG